MHWRRKWQCTPVFLPGESQGQGSLLGCHLWGRTESDRTEVSQQQQQWLHICFVYLPGGSEFQGHFPLLLFSHLFLCTVFNLFLTISMGFPGSSVVKDPLANAGDTGDESLIPGSGRSPGEGNPLQYSCVQSYLNVRLSQVEQNGSLPRRTASLPRSAVCPCLALWELVASPSLVPSVKVLTSRHRDLLPPVSSFRLWVCPRSLQDHLLSLTYVLSPA